MRKSVPEVLQMENVECGAASLAMILRYYGNYSVSLEQLRLDCHVSRDGVTAKGIKTAAEKYGLKCRVLKADPESIKMLAMPVIIHWNMSHFVVLTGFDKNNYYINDPAIGSTKVSRDEFDHSFTGIVMLFEKTAEFKSERGRKETSFTYFRIKPFFPALILISFLGAVVTVTSMIIPYFNSSYIDIMLLETDTSGFEVFIIALLAVVLLRFFAEIIKEKASYETERNMNISLSVGFMEKILKLPIIYFMQRTPGELANRQLGSFETAQLVCENLSPIFFQAVLVAVYCAAAFKFDVPIALIGVAAVLLNTVISYISSNKMSDVSAINKKNTGMYYGALVSSIDMMDTIKSSACEESIFVRLTGTAAMCTQPRIQREIIKLYSSAAFETVNFAVSAAILLTGTFRVLNGEFSIGVTVGLMGMFSAFLVPIGAFINSVSAIFDLKSIYNRTDDTMRYDNEDIFLPENIEQTKTMGNDIRLENVAYTYGGSEKNAVTDISFEIKKGKSVALTGESGGGKSTVAKMIAGLFSETVGHIYYGDAEKKDIHKSNFYSKIAVVSQSVIMYEGTVFDNIAMWNKNVEYEDVVRACKTACIHNDIIARKGAYYEKITEGGANFSGGQRQRFEIARALVRSPEILVLDEATSALDANTEAEIMKNITSLGITLIIIAHRLNTVRNCDEILVFKDGGIAERGTHKSLLEQNGIYARLIKEG